MTSTPLERMNRSRFALWTTAAALAVGLSAPTTLAQYSSNNVEMFARVSLSQLGASAGNDCWGYVSPSGREYALMGVADAIVVVEITDPSNPDIIGEVSHGSSIWGDVKTYDQYAYAVNEDGGGIDVIDLRDVDNGNVSLVRRVTSNGQRTAHNVAVDEASGFLYTVGGNLANGGLVAWDLSNPANPTYAGQWSGDYAHDAQIVTFDTGPYAGKQIAFCCCGGRGLEIVDVTNKSNMVRLSRTTYPGIEYCHQGWLSEDGRYFYSNDELDELNGRTPTTRTLVFDVTDLSAPVLVNTFTTGSSAIDHNLYIRDGFIYEANYTSGMHIFDARSNPTDPEYVGYFDTYPNNNRPGFDGAWSVYPFFPSGVTIVSDQNDGLFILDVSPAVGGGGIELDADPFFGGQPATVYASSATANETVYFVYSLRGQGSTFVPALNVTLDLDRPSLAGSDVADANGDASFTSTIPAAGVGLTVWLQAAEQGRKSNVISREIQ